MLSAWHARHVGWYTMANGAAGISCRGSVGSQCTSEAGEDLILLVHSPKCKLSETLDLGIQFQNLIVKANV